MATKRAERERALREVVADLHRVEQAVDAADVDAVKRCPAGTSASGAPVVDSAWLGRLAGNRADPEAARSLALIRHASFSDRLLASAAAPGRAETGSLSDAEDIRKAKLLVVVVAQDYAAPIAIDDGFVGGSLLGAVVVVDRASGRPLCQTTLAARSSENISYGGGVRLKVKGIPGPKLGSKSLQTALDADFTKNVSIAVRAALVTVGAT